MRSTYFGLQKSTFHCSVGDPFVTVTVISSGFQHCPKRPSMRNSKSVLKHKTNRYSVEEQPSVVDIVLCVTLSEGQTSLSNIQQFIG